MGVQRLLAHEPFIEHELARVCGVAMQLVNVATRLLLGGWHQRLEQGRQFLFVPCHGFHVYVQNYVIVVHFFALSYCRPAAPAVRGITVGSMQLGFVSAIVPDLALEEVFVLAKDAGYDCVEVMCWPAGPAQRRYAGVTHIDAAALEPAAVARVHAVVQKTGVAISGLGYYPNPLTPVAAEAKAATEHLRRVIVAAEALGVPVVNTFVGRDWTKSVDDNWPRFVAVWSELLGFAEDHGVKIAIENCPMLFTRDEWPGGKNLAASPAIWRRMFEAIPSASFGLNYDPSHLLWQQMDHLAPVREFASRIFHVHFKDVMVDRDRLDEVGILAYPNDFHTPKLPGRGEIDWGAFVGVLREVGYEGAGCVEVEERAYEGSAALRVQALTESCRHLRQFLPC